MITIELYYHVTGSLENCRVNKGTGVCIPHLHVLTGSFETERADHVL